MEKHNSTDIRSEKAGKIIDQEPSFFVKHGILFISLMLLIILCIVVSIPFKETIPIRGSILTKPEDYVIRSETVGKIFLSSSSGIINKDDEIAYLFANDTIKTLKAPITGHLNTPLRDGNAIAPGDILFIINPTIIDNYYIEAEIPLSLETNIEEGDTVLLVNDSVSLEGTINKKFIENSGESKRSLKIRFELIQKDRFIFKKAPVVFGKVIINRRSLISRIVTKK